MKLKNYLRLLPLALLLLGTSQSAQAQITSVDVSAFAYVSSSCMIPAPVEISAYGMTFGTFASTDSLAVTFFFGDGSDTTYNIAPGMSGMGTVDSFGTGLMHFYTLPGSYTPMVTILGPGGVTDTAYTMPFTVSNTCGNLSGNIYADADGDCTYDVGETLLSGIYVQATNTTTGSVYYSMYTSTGAYNMNLPAGYTYTVTTGSWWTGMTSVCPAGGTATVTVASSGTYTQDFGFDCSGASPDMSVYAFATSFRPGYIRPLYIQGSSDQFCDVTPATITLTLPALTSFASTWWGPAPTVSGSTLTWNVSSLSGVDNFSAAIGIMSSSAAVLGDSACITITITPVGTTDPELSNNTYSVCIPFTNAYDPNEKLVAPKGMGDLGLIPVGTELLTYQVNFQNTGNDTAYNVTIKDLLDASIDPASVHILDGSHPFTANIVNGNELQFRFSDIMLPDSNINEPASHGYVRYQARLNPSISSSATINNTAYIYFDYNDAIVTNTTVNTLYTPTSVQQLNNGSLSASVYPNPASNMFTVKVGEDQFFTAILSDITGRVVSGQHGKGQMNISTRALPDGVYNLSIQSKDAVLHTKVVIRK